ncbi:MAG: polysaccharide biosynthesis C-terminal domain-containing protein [Sideroxyarcus sp.]|nr:polysaccharide biosynthesis C-terminal domain-containing protein [Sideroxyarcus sp.]
MSREVLRDAIIYLPAKVVPALVGVLAIPILTRLLTPEQYGQYLLAMTSLTLIAAFCISWLVSITIRFYVVYGVEALYRYSRRFLILSILLACLLWLAASQLLGNAFSNRFFILAGVLWLVAHGFFEYYSGWLRARNFAKAYSIALSWRSATGLSIAVVLLALGFRDGAIIVLGFAVAMLVGLAFLPKYALQAEIRQRQVNESKSDLKVILHYGIPAAISNLVITGLSLADRYIIGAQMGAESVAIYGASYDLAEKTVFFANSMLLLSSSVIGFRIFEQEGEVKAADFLSRLMRIYLLAAPPLVVALAILSPHIVGLLLPAQYQAGALVLPIVAAGGLFVGVMHRYSLLLSFHKRTDTIMWCSAGALLVNLLSCVLLIPKFGIIGAAISTVVAYASWLFFVRLAATKYHGPSFPWLTFFRASGALLVAAAAMVSILQLELTYKPLMLVLSFVFGMFAYSFALYLFREITQKDVQAVVSIISSRLRKA